MNAKKMIVWNLYQARRVSVSLKLSPICLVNVKRNKIEDLPCNTGVKKREHLQKRYTNITE